MASVSFLDCDKVIAKVLSQLRRMRLTGSLVRLTHHEDWARRCLMQLLVRLTRLRLNRRPYCSSSGSSSQDRAKLIEYQTEGLIKLRVQFIYNETVPLLLVLVVGLVRILILLVIVCA